MWHHHTIVADNTMKNSINDEKDNNIAFKKMRDVIASWKYHQDATVKSILRKQSDRIATTMDRLEAELQKKDGKYTPIGLGDAWKSFMRGRAEMVKVSTETFLDTWIDKMETAWDLGKGSGDKKGSGDENTDPNKPGENKANLRSTRFAKLKEERANMGVWMSPV